MLVGVISGDIARRSLSHRMKLYSVLLQSYVHSSGAESDNTKSTSSMGNNSSKGTRSHDSKHERTKSFDKGLSKRTGPMSSGPARTQGTWDSRKSERTHRHTSHRKKGSEFDRPDRRRYENRQPIIHHRAEDLLSVVYSPKIADHRAGNKLGASEAGVSSIGTTVNKDMLPFLRYAVTGNEVSRFLKGDMKDGELRSFIDRVRAVAYKPIPSSVSSLKKDIEKNATVSRIEYDLLKSADDLWTGEKGAVTEEIDQDIIGRDRDELKELLSDSDKQFEKIDASALKFGQKHQLNKRESPNLMELMKDFEPKEPYLEKAAASKLKTLQENPFWPPDKKVIFAQRLLKQLSTIT